MSYYALSALINGLTSTLVGLYVFTRDPSDQRYRSCALFCLSLAIWSCGYFFWQIARDPGAAFFWIRILMAGAIFIPLTNFHHVLDLLGYTGKKVWLWSGYAVGLVFLSLNAFSDLLVRGLSARPGFPFWPDPGPAFHLYLTFFGYCVIHFTYLLTRELRRASGIKKNQLTYLLIALALGYVGGLTNFPLWYHIPLPPYGNVLVSVYIILFSYAVVKFHLLDIHVVVKRSVVYALLLMLLLVPCYFFLLWIQAAFFGSRSPAFSLITLIMLIIAGFLFPKVRFLTEEAFERALFKRRSDYRETLLRSSKDMVSMVDLQSIADKTVRTVAEALGIENTSLFFIDDTKGLFSLRSKVGKNANPMEQSMIPREDPLLQKWTKIPDVLIREEIENAQKTVEDINVVRRMGELGAEVSLPLVSKEKLIGALNLGRKETGQMYSHEDLELLSTLANQAAIALENAQLYENLKQSQNIIRRTDRLSSLGVLTAGLAHEIRNPLVAIRTFTQLLPERYEDREFREEFQVIALREVDRICGLVNDLLSFARPSTHNISSENINEVVENIARILETQAKEKGVQIYRRLAPNLPKIWIDKEQLKQVFMNIILNAIQSIEGSGVVEVSTRLFKKDSSELFVQIGIRDSGIGIPDQDLENIFNPFFTTKKDGSGLGLSISHQIVQEHGGYMLVESKLGEGTTFLIHLAVKQLIP